MGRNFHSVCHACRVTLMHFRGKEGDHMQQFANDHYGHLTEIMDDYTEEPPEDYTDVFDVYNPEFDKAERSPSVDTATGEHGSSQRTSQKEEATITHE